MLLSGLWRRELQGCWWATHWQRGSGQRAVRVCGGEHCEDQRKTATRTNHDGTGSKADCNLPEACYSSGRRSAMLLGVERGAAGAHVNTISKPSAVPTEVPVSLLTLLAAPAAALYPLGSSCAHIYHSRGGILGYLWSHGCGARQKGLTPLRMTDPIAAPLHWKMTYNTPRSSEILRVRNMPRVTAGLM